MTRSLVWLSFICLTCLGFFGTDWEGRALARWQAQNIPWPPLPIYHSQPGPFLAQIDLKGVSVDRGVVKNSVQQWSGPQLSAFSICFQPATKPVDWDLALKALKSTSEELRAQGAAVVVVEATRICASSPHPSMAGKPYVEIKGVIRTTD